MFAIIETGGKQYKVEKGATLDIEKIDGKEGDSVNFDKVLLLSDKETKVGTPLVEGAYATAKIIAHKRDKKIIVFKMKPKKRYQRTQGHRQDLTTVEITDIKTTGGKTVKKAPAKKAAAPKKEA